mmetsp:Transcript_128975/g.413092  ORF Transcript_128975/g.413092 Transcript_128975/m.413092 type:complete len:261 (-) Transcript_128975:3774-4556(-)
MPAMPPAPAPVTTTPAGTASASAVGAAGGAAAAASAPLLLLPLPDWAVGGPPVGCCCGVACTSFTFLNFSWKRALIAANLFCFSAARPPATAPEAKLPATSTAAAAAVGRAARRSASCTKGSGKRGAGSSSRSRGLGKRGAASSTGSVPGLEDADAAPASSTADQPPYACTFFIAFSQSGGGWCSATATRAAPGFGAFGSSTAMTASSSEDEPTTKGFETRCRLACWPEGPPAHTGGATRATETKPRASSELSLSLSPSG